MTWCSRCGSERCCPTCGSTCAASNKAEAVIAAAKAIVSDFTEEEVAREPASVRLAWERARALQALEAETEE